MPQKIDLEPTKKHIMVLAGEASGDQHGAEMVRALRKLNANISVSGMGSKHMKKAGVDVFFDSASIAVMGIVEVIKHWGAIKKAMALVKRQLETQKPDLLVCIDYQEFNQKMAAHAKSLGIKVLFYISPQVWAWRPKRVKKVGERIDHMAVIFPFEVDFYTKYNIPVTYVGHPLVDKLSKPESIQSLEELENGKMTIGLFPGSRQSELTRLLPTMLEGAQKLIKIYGDTIQFVLPVAETLDKAQVEQMVADAQVPVKLYDNELYPLIKSCDAIVSCSGTVTLEIALLGVPMCVLYKFSWLSNKIVMSLLIIKLFCLVNIVAERLVVKEMLQDEANAQNIAEEITRIIENKAYAETMREGLQDVKQRLGDGGGSKNIAQLALNMLEN